MAVDTNDLGELSTKGLARRLGLATATALDRWESHRSRHLLDAGRDGQVPWLTVLAARGLASDGRCHHRRCALLWGTGGSLPGSRRYLRLPERDFGKRTAFLYGWLSLLVTDPGLTAMLAVGLAPYVGHLIPLAAWGSKAVAAGSIIILAAVHTLGVSPGSRVMGALAALKVGLLGFLVVWGFGLGRGDWSNLTPFWSQRPGSDSFVPALGIALVGAFIAFAGWWDVSKIAGEVRDPRAHDAACPDAGSFDRRGSLRCCQRGVPLSGRAVTDRG